MKQNWLRISFIPVLIILYGCPYRSSYRLDATPILPLNEGILGKWAAFVAKPGKERPEPVKVILSRRNDEEYDISITGYIDEMRPFKVIDNDTIKATGYLSDVDGRMLMNLLLKDQCYIAEVRMAKGKLSLLPLIDYFTSKLIKSNTELRNAVAFHFKTRLRPMFDEEFCLRDMVRVN